MSKKTKIIVTLGPATLDERSIFRMKEKGVDFVRVNMSHSSIEDLRYAIGLAKRAGIPFIIDTDGPQIRLGSIPGGEMAVDENDEVEFIDPERIRNGRGIPLRPAELFKQFETGDIVYIDTESMPFCIQDVSGKMQGVVSARSLARGTLKSNKAAVIDPEHLMRSLPPLTQKDLESIAIGLQEGVGHISISYVRSGSDVDEVRRATKGRMKIISKIERRDALVNLAEIIQKSDAILLDRIDLSKEVPQEKIPSAQDYIFKQAHSAGREVIVASNLLESMAERKKPLLAEVNDISRMVREGVSAFTLSTETAIGKHPFEAITVLANIFRQADAADSVKSGENPLAHLLDRESGSSLISPHGGVLVERVLDKRPPAEHLDRLAHFPLSEELQMDVEQIAIGTYSPLSGFMGEKDVKSVLENMRLANGLPWTIPIVLDAAEKFAEHLRIGSDILLTDQKGAGIAILHLQEKFKIPKDYFAQKLYGTSAADHPGVLRLRFMGEVFLAGPLGLLQRRSLRSTGYELTPRQTRRLFAERHWSRVVGFHTRNVIHRSHEFIQLAALEDVRADGLFVHPVIGKKKSGDYHSRFIVKSYERMMKDFYPPGKVVLATFATYSRYAGPREAIFTALCRKNFGCTHFIIGRDHTGVGKFYTPDASHRIFDEFPDLGIIPVRFNEVSYSNRHQRYVRSDECPELDSADLAHISGTEARKMFERGEMPPEWFMRPEISEIIVKAIRGGEEVFWRES